MAALEGLLVGGHLSKSRPSPLNCELVDDGIVCTQCVDKWEQRGDDLLWDKKGLP